MRIGEDRGRALRDLGPLVAVGYSFVLAIVIGVAGGYALDRWLGSSPWFFLLGFLVGTAAGIRNVFKAAGGLGRPRS